MGELTGRDIKKAAVEILLKVVKAHHLSERIAEALANAIDINIWKKVLIGKSSDDIHIDFRLTFKGVNPEEIGEDVEINVILYEMVDGKPITELFSQALLKTLKRISEDEYADKVAALKEDEFGIVTEVIDDRTVVATTTDKLAEAIEAGKLNVEELGDVVAKEGKEPREKYSKIEVKFKDKKMCAVCKIEIAAAGCNACDNCCPGFADCRTCPHD